MADERFRNSRRTRRRFGKMVAAAALVASVCGPALAGAQPEVHVPPLVDGRLLVGGDVSATLGSDDTGFFNHTDYDISLLRLAVVQIDAEWRLGGRASLVGELRSENDHGVRGALWFLRVRPVARLPLALEVGRVPHVFGQATNRRYGHDNPVIGLPLAYQYLTSLRTDAVPATADDLLRVRGRGWLLTYPSGVGVRSPSAGLPLFAVSRNDTGVKASWNPGGNVEVQAALTMGSLSRPLVTDDNEARQVSARVVTRPSPGLVVGVSAARGAYLSDVARDAVAVVRQEAPREWYQEVVGADLEWSRGHWVTRIEALASRWDTPQLGAPRLTPRVETRSAMAEARYRIHARAWIAGRAEHLWFSRITGTLFGGAPTPWDAPVTRLEGGGGVFLTRQLVFKATYQHDWRDAGRTRSPHLAAVQLACWF